MSAERNLKLEIVYISNLLKKILFPIGNNIMYIGMMGPKGPCDELVVKHQGNLVYKVDYKVKETGRYMLIVRWGDQDIPGSPFAVEVQ